MGRFISTGIIYQYGINKAHIPGIESSNTKQEIIDQLFPDIYDFREDENYLYFKLSDKVSVSDIISTIENYYDLIHVFEHRCEEFERVKQRLENKSIDDVYKIAEEMPSYLFQTDEIGYSYEPFYIPLLSSEKRALCPVHIWCILIDPSPNKTYSEDEFCAFPFYTDLLRYRMKPEKLADSMLIYISQ